MDGMGRSEGTHAGVDFVLLVGVHCGDERGLIEGILTRNFGKIMKRGREVVR